MTESEVRESKEMQLDEQEESARWKQSMIALEADQSGMKRNKDTQVFEALKLLSTHKCTNITTATTFS